MPALRVNTDNDARKISHEEGEAAMQTARTKGKGREGKERLSSKLFITSAPKNFPRNCSLSGGWKQTFRGTRVRGEGGGERERELLKGGEETWKGGLHPAR